MNLTKTLALELGDRRIRVNCIAPDVIPTPGHRRRRAGEDAAAVSPATSTTSRPRRSTSRPTRSRFVTGTTIHVDGGNLAAGGWGRAADGSWVTAGDAKSVT